MKRIELRNRGMTMIELLVAVAIVGLIAAVAAPIIIQLTAGTGRSSASNTAMTNINNAAYWVCHDGQMAHDTTLVEGANPVDHVILDWTDNYGGTTVSHTSSYSLSGDELQRDYDGDITTVARGISSVFFSISGRTITVSISYSDSERTETKTYEVQMRPVV